MSPKKEEITAAKYVRIMPSIEKFRFYVQLLVAFVKNLIKILIKTVLTPHLSNILSVTILIFS